MTASAFQLNPATFPDDLLMLVNRLLQLILQEEQILSERRPLEIRDIVEEKNKLYLIYRSALAALKKDPALLTNTRRDHRERLKIAIPKLHDAVERLGEKLSRLRNINEGILKAIGDEVARRNAPVQAYGKDAILGSAASQQKLQKPTSVILNQSV